jgi:hypothetical protein
VCAGALADLVLGLASMRYIASLFCQVKATDPVVLALPAVIHAVRIDPVTMLRSE